MALWLPHYERRQGVLPPEIRTKVLAISAPQIDRLLAPCRARTRRKRGRAPPGVLLDHAHVRDARRVCRVQREDPDRAGADDDGEVRRDETPRQRDGVYRVR